MSLVYWDTMLFIYWLEAHPQHGKKVEQIHERMAQRGDQLCTSMFTVGEILTGAYKTGRTKEAGQIRVFLIARLYASSPLLWKPRIVTRKYVRSTIFPQPTQSTWPVLP